MPDEARDGRNVAFELSSDLLVCSIVQRNHSTINSACLITSITCHYQVEFLVCRALTFLKKSFDGTVPPMELAPVDEELVATVTKELRAFNEGLDKMK